MLFISLQTVYSEASRCYGLVDTLRLPSSSQVIMEYGRPLILGGTCKVLPEFVDQHVRPCNLRLGPTLCGKLSGGYLEISQKVRTFPRLVEPKHVNKSDTQWFTKQLL